MTAARSHIWPTRHERGALWLHAPARRALGVSQTTSMLVGFVIGVLAAFVVGCALLASLAGVMAPCLASGP